MKLRTYLKELEKFVEKNPDALDYEVVTNRYDEIFTKSRMKPKLGWFDGHNDFVLQDEFEDCDMDDSNINAICI